MKNFTLPPATLNLLEGLQFPVTTDELADFAKDRGAPEEILAQLRFYPDHVFESLEDINLTYGLIEEFQGAENPWLSISDDELPAPEEAALTVTGTTETDGAAP